MSLAGFEENKAMENVPHLTVSQAFLYECAGSFTQNCTVNYRDGDVSLIAPEQERQGKKSELQHNSASF